jgi:hypothetical protein
VIAGEHPVNILLRLAVVLVAAVHVPFAGAAVFRVGPGASCTHSSLAAALADTVTNGPGRDEIRLTLAVQTVNAAFTLLGSDVTIIGGYGSCNDPEPSPGARSVIVGNAHDSVFYVGGNRQVVLQQLDISNGGRPGFVNGDFAVGGGLWLDGGTATLHGVRIAHNRARMGGGLAATGNSVLVIFPGASGSIIEENQALLGGGIYVGERATLRIENDRVSVVRNAANESANAWENLGGGIYARGGVSTGANIEVASLLAEPGVPTPPISGFVLAENTATGDGGGMALVGNAHFNAIEATLRDNVAGGAGGAIAALGQTIGPGASVTLMRRHSAHPAWLPACAGLYGCNRLEGNVATRGGGIFVMHGQLYLAQMLMARNRSTAGGGAAISTGNINGAPSPVNRVRLHSMVIARNQCAGPTPSSPCSTLNFRAGPNELKLQHVTLADNVLQAGANGGATEIGVFGAANPLVIRWSSAHRSSSPALRPRRSASKARLTAIA